MGEAGPRPLPTRGENKSSGKRISIGDLIREVHLAEGDMGFWQTFISVGLGSGFALGVTKFFFDWFKDWRDRRGKQQFFALRLASTLEGFAIRCARNVSSHQMHAEHDGNVGGPISGIKPPQFPENTPYELIDPSLVDAIFDFPQRCEMAEEAAYFWWDVVGDSDAYSEALEENTIEVGVLALLIARRLRTKYRLQSRNLTFGQWSIDEFFDSESKAIMDRKKKHDARNAAAAEIFKESTQ